jgi:tetratricopeptide (TPR) repeat protein
LSIADDNIGDALLAQGKLDEAKQSYEADLGITLRLAQSDPDDALWQRDLSVSYNKFGQALEAQRHFPEALASYRQGLAIRKRLADSDPGNTGWQLDLSTSYERVGDVLLAQNGLVRRRGASAVHQGARDRRAPQGAVSRDDIRRRSRLV